LTYLAYIASMLEGLPEGERRSLAEAFLGRTLPLLRRIVTTARADQLKRSLTALRSLMHATGGYQEVVPRAGGGVDPGRGKSFPPGIAVENCNETTTAPEGVVTQRLPGASNSRGRRPEGARLTPVSERLSPHNSACLLAESRSGGSCRIPPAEGDDPPTGENSAPPQPSDGGPQGGTLYPSLVAARAGDPDGLARLLEAARPILAATIAPRLAGGWCEAWTPDVIQEALLDIVRSHASCRASSEPEAVAWVAALGRRQVATLFRREARRRELPLDAARRCTDDLPPPSPRIARALDLLRTALRDLRDDQHRLLWARWILSLTWQEVGQELETTAGGAKRRWQGLCRHLRCALGSW